MVPPAREVRIVVRGGVSKSLHLLASAFWTWCTKRLPVLLPSVALTLLLGWVKTMRGRKKIKRGSLENVVTCQVFSVRQLERGFVEHFTIFERALADVYHDAALVDIVKESVKQATARDTSVSESSHVLPVPPEYQWMVYNVTLNQISATFSHWYLMADAGVTVKMVSYVFTLIVFHNVGHGRYFVYSGGKQKPLDESLDHGMRRLKAVVLREDMLKAVHAGDVHPPEKFLNERHQERWELVKELAQKYADNGERPVFMRFEVPIPQAGGGVASRPSYASLSSSFGI